jgi:RNase P subunit RPR2
MTWYKNLKAKRKERIRNLNGIQGYSKSYSISARIGKHFCPNCNELLRIIKKEEIINSESEEAKNYDFSFDEGRKIGNIKFIYDVFYCEKCDLVLSVKDVLRFRN